MCWKTKKNNLEFNKKKDAFRNEFKKWLIDTVLFDKTKDTDK